jgi:hypothetical protein
MERLGGRHFLNRRPLNGHVARKLSLNQQSLVVGFCDRPGQPIPILQNYLIGEKRGTESEY